MSDLGFARHTSALADGHFLRVVNYHNTPWSRRHSLRAELASLGERYRSVSLSDLDHFYATGQWPGGGCRFMPVFYEGYRSSVMVAAPVCDELGITAWFPVCTGFIECPPREQEYFARSHWIGLVGEDWNDKRLAMSWDEVGQLAQRHVVTPHTASHIGISDVRTDEDIEREITAPKQKMDAATGQSAPAFVWLHGTGYGLSERHDRAVREAGYRYQFSNTMLHRIG